MITYSQFIKESKDAKGHGSEKKTNSEKHAVMAFGRMNPPTAGHEEVVKKMHSVAKEHGAEHHLVLSHSEDKKKNPLPVDKKVAHAKNAFPGTNVRGASKEKPTILHHAADLHKAGVQHLHVVAGSDRHQAMHDLLHKYNDGKEHGHGSYKFKSITLHSSGERDPDSEGTSGISGTKMREHAASGNKKDFHANLPKSMKPEHKDALYHDLRHHMGVKEEIETGEQLVEDDSFLSKLISRHKRGEKLGKTEHELVKAHLKRNKLYTKSKNAISSEFKEEIQIDELSSELLSRYKEGAKKSADELTAKGQHKKSTDRWMGVMKATGKQIEKTTANIKKALRREETEEQGNDRMKQLKKFKEMILDMQLQEVLSKDASAGQWIHDFVHSDNPKFAGKSKEKRKQMALAAYYAKQRNEEVELDEAVHPSEVAGNPRMYDAATVKKAYYHKNATPDEKKTLERRLDRHHGMRDWRKPVKEEAEQIDELSRDTLLSYANKVSLDSQKHSKDPTKRSGEKASRSVTGYARAHNRLEKPVKEEAELEEGVFKGTAEVVKQAVRVPYRAVKRVAGAALDTAKDVGDAAKNIKKKFKEEVELEESATVKTQKYSWGTMKTVHHGKDFSIPLHPEHHEPIAKLKDNQEQKFKDETGRHWTAKRMGDDVHFHSANDGPKTKVAHKHIAEGVIQPSGTDKIETSGSPVSDIGNQNLKVKKVKSFKFFTTEAAKTGNPGFGYHGAHKTEHDSDAAYDKMHSHVKSLTDGDDKTVKHYLDSAHGRHLVGHENDHEHIKKDFKKFKKHYRPEMHEEVEHLDEKITLDGNGKVVDHGPQKMRPKNPAPAGSKSDSPGFQAFLAAQRKKRAEGQAHANATAEKIKGTSMVKEEVLREARVEIEKDEYDSIKKKHKETAAANRYGNHANSLHVYQNDHGHVVNQTYAHHSHGLTTIEHEPETGKHYKYVKEEAELDEAFINGREYASQGVMHPEHAKMHKVGDSRDFYAHGTGDKISGKVTKNDGKEVHIQADKTSGGKTHKFKVTPHLPKQQNEAVKPVNVDKVNAAGQEPHEEKWEPAKKKMKKESVAFSDFLKQLDEIKMADLPGRKIQGKSYGANYEDPEGAFETKDDMKKAEPKKAGRKVGQKVGARANLGNSKLHRA